MNKETLKALKGSIKHWEENVRRAQTNKCLSIDSGSCPLCDMFVINWGSCKECPVMKKTKYTHCSHTPYGNVIEILYEIADYHIDTKALVSACKEELKFLKSLLPKKIKRG